MTVFYVSSRSKTGSTVTTRHFVQSAAETEQQKRLHDGHTGVSVQEAQQHANGVETCVKPKVLPMRRGGRHA